MAPVPFQYTFNGSNDFNSGNVSLKANASAPTTAEIDALVAAWATRTSSAYTWRGASSTGMRGRGVSWAATTQGNSLTNGFLTPNSPIPDYVVHWSGFFGPKSWHRGGANVLFADGHVAKVNDEGGFQDNPDSWLGPYKSTPTTLTSTAFTINASGYDEVRDSIWLEQIGSAGGGVGGGSVE